MTSTKTTTTKTTTTTTTTKTLTSKKITAKSDDLSLASNPIIGRMLAKFGVGKEEIYFSDFFIKINQRGKAQTRVILLTDKALYNVKPNNYTSCRRRIDYKHLLGITVSLHSEEFVVHVPEEYDYRFKSPRKDDFVAMIGKLILASQATRKDKKRKKLPIQYMNEAELKEHVVTKNLARKENRMEALQRRKKWEDHESDEDDRKFIGVGKGLTPMTAKRKLESDDEKVKVSDFELLKVLGRGSFGKVMLVKKKDDGKVYAMKIMKKRAIIQKRQVDHTRAERDILQDLNHPFLMTLRYAFQSEEKLYLVLDYYTGGELFFHLKNCRRFAEEVAKIYIAEITLAFGYLHSKDIIYRDLKPENVLLDDDGHICLTDFGLAKQMTPTKKANTFCGTPEYLAPEVILGIGHDKGVDWWSLGILLYELTIGIPPFYSQNVNEMYEKIQHGILKFPPFLTKPCKQFIIALLRRDPKKRLGYKNDAEDLKEHRFFDDIDWDALMEKKIKVNFKPNVKSETDTTNFDSTFTKEPVVDSVVTDSQLQTSLDEGTEKFKGFTFVEKKSNDLL